MIQTAGSDAVATLRNQGGYFRASDYGLVEIYGKDAPKFLQSQTTNDVLKLAECSGQSSCLLDRKAHIRAFFHLFRRHDSFRIVVERHQIPTILEHLEEYKFNETVEFLDLSETGGFFAIQGPHVLKLIRQANPVDNHLAACIEHDVSDLKLWDTPVHAFRKSVTGEIGYFLWITKSQLEEFQSRLEKACSSQGFVKLSQEAQKIARIEAGLPRFSIDFNAENLLPETGLEEEAASYTKGCFLGQEVLARVKSHGSPARALVGLRFTNRLKREPPVDLSFVVNGENAAAIKSNCFSSVLDACVALAFVKREHRVPGKVLTGELDGEPVEATVTLLPFYTAEPTQVKANRLYEKGLGLFPSESDEIVESPAVTCLRESLELDPLLEDAYEVLGVVLSKRGRLDEAIGLMKRLAQINPDSVMAHTNLSVFYVQKGLKEEAEEEKAISLSIRMRLAARHADLAKQQEADKQKQKEETLARMEMFKQVLAIDAEDELANYGLGSCLVDLEQFEEAVPYLQKAISIKPINSLAYLSLAAAYEELGQKNDCIEILKKGIEVASKRGDITPLHQMQDKLSTLAGTQRSR
jgi:folate-binding protein YgfZ